MFSHVCVGISDFPRALSFYTAVMAELGFTQKFVDHDAPCAAWVQPGVTRPLFFITKPFDGAPPSPGNGQMAAFLAPKRAAVDRAHAAALAHGGICEGKPGPRPAYHPDYYGAYMRDPDGNKLCVCCHAPEPPHE